MGDSRDAGDESIRVVCRFRPLNSSEEKAGSKFIIKFPEGDSSLYIGVSTIYQFS